MGEGSQLPPHRPRPPGAATALDGIRVIDFTRVIAGPFCTQLLADLGAEVVKIENPAGGDDTRSYQPVGPAGESGAYLGLNRNKRGIALDLASPAARQVARALIERADVVVENFSAGVMARFDLDYATVSADNPRLVYCSISAYGRDGPFAGRSGFDPVVQAESGFMSMIGYPDRAPVRTGPPVVDMATGMMASNAILAALVARDRLGRGQHVEAALFDHAVAMTGMYGMNYLVTGADQTRFGHAPPGAVPVGLFEAADGAFYLACANDRLYRRLAIEVLGRPDLADHPDYARNRDRAANRDKLLGILGGIFAGDSRDNWVAKMKAANVPAGPLRSIAEAFNAPEVRERHLVGGIPHPTAGSVPNIVPPIRLALTPTVDPVAAPLLGQHTEAVLRDVLGYDRDRLAALAAAGAFGAPAAIGGEPSR